MLVLVTYDVSFDDPNGPARLRRIAKICEDFGTRVQYSVFECDLEPDQWVRLKARLLDTYDEAVDSLRFYMLGKNWRRRIEHHGAKAALDLFKSPLII
ncbi:CRISPR-associated endonuclease Cas2 [Nitrincola tibetensis]|uniref:CRISPR-associated endoribonuclease Cas2 n=1 Tax=Nitrincola tibetensis TaxID=2219697 RepID=A0A364NS65_9GAMM|nr:CRISPR-associated endonuclease Cas2 [Nitrincola tibetensis]RAU19894.1 CRISPR-associated endonuclease Cas2 [Nitrincola tibetensis]